MEEEVIHRACECDPTSTDCPHKADWMKLLIGYDLGMAVGTYCNRVVYVDPATHAYHNDSPIEWSPEGQRADGRSSPETRSAISKALTGIKRSPESNRRNSEAHKGLKASATTRQKMSDAHKGKVFTPEHLANIKAAALNRPPREVMVNTCRHPERKHRALHMCNSCYQTHLRHQWHTR